MLTAICPLGGAAADPGTEAMQNLATNAMPQEGGMTAEERKLADLIVSTLNLDVQVAEIDPAGPLYGDGLGLDSIDILEIALAISKAYGIKLRSDDDNNKKIFSSLRELNQHIQRHRAK
jgi:acyl carrier protein